MLQWWEPYRAIIYGSPRDQVEGKVAVWGSDREARSTYIPDIIGPGYVKVL